jgi:hypothetical protein
MPSSHRTDAVLFAMEGAREESGRCIKGQGRPGCAVQPCRPCEAKDGEKAEGLLTPTAVLKGFDSTAKNIVILRYRDEDRMPKTQVYFYMEEDGSVPALEWLLELREKNERAAKKCFSLVTLLRDMGSELRRPRADFLRDGVYELRTKVGSVNYRILYGFAGKDVAVLASGLTKEKTVPAKEIDRAALRIAKYKKNPARHRYELEEESTNGKEQDS